MYEELVLLEAPAEDEPLSIEALLAVLVAVVGVMATSPTTLTMTCSGSVYALPKAAATRPSAKLPGMFRSSRVVSRNRARR